MAEHCRTGRPLATGKEKVVFKSAGLALVQFEGKIVGVPPGWGGKFILSPKTLALRT